MFLSTALINKRGHTLAGRYSIFPRKRPRPNLKVFEYQIWSSVKKIGEVDIK